MTYHPRTTTASARYWTGLVALFPSSAWFFLMVWAVLPTLLLGWEPVAIISDSMAPRINRGDVVLAAAPGDAVLGPGDVVVFNDPARSGRVTHRILAVTPDGDYVTKGDGNERRDSTPISPSEVVGVGQVLVPIVGLVLVWLREGQIFRFATTVLVLGALAWWSRWAFITEPPRRQRRPPPTLGSPGEQDATPEPGVSPPVSTGRNRAVFLFGAVFVVMGLLLAAGFSRSAVSASTNNAGNSVTAASSFGPSVFYLHNDPTPPTGDTASHAVLAFDATAAAASVLYNYDTDRDGDAGLVLSKSSLGLAETDLTKYQIWSVLGPIDLDGPATLTLWGAIKSFDTTKRGVVLVGLLDCALDGSDCNTIATGTLDVDPWDSAGSGTWVEKTIDLGTVTHTIGAARTLRVKIVVGDNSGDNMWFAYDTTSYDSHLQIGP